MQPNNYQQPANVVPTPVPTAPIKSAKTNTALVAILAIIAIAGLGFGGYELWQNINMKESNTNNCITTDGDKNAETAVVEEKDNINLLAMAESLSAPYLIELGMYDYILTEGLTEGAKVILAFHSVSSWDMLDTDTTIIVGNTELKSEYEKLFGEEITLDQEEYSLSGQKCAPQLTKNGSTSYETNGSACGGYGWWNKPVVKDAFMDGDKIDVEVYYVNAELCNEDDNEFCFVTSGAKMVDDGNMGMDSLTADFIAENAPETPVYTMVFSQKSNRYVLTDIIAPEE